MKAQRRDEQSLQPGGSPIKNAVNQRANMKTMPMAVKNTNSTAKDACYNNVNNTVNNRKA